MTIGKQKIDLKSDLAIPMELFLHYMDQTGQKRLLAWIFLGSTRASGGIWIKLYQVLTFKCFYCTDCISMFHKSQDLNISSSRFPSNRCEGCHFGSTHNSKGAGFFSGGIFSEYSMYKQDVYSRCKSTGCFQQHLDSQILDHDSSMTTLTTFTSRTSHLFPQILDSFLTFYHLHSCKASILQLSTEDCHERIFQ